MKKAMLLVLSIFFMLFSLSTYAVHTTQTTSINQENIEQKLGRKLNLKERIGLAVLKRTLKKSAKHKTPKHIKQEGDCAEITLETGDVILVKIQEMTPLAVTYIKCGQTDAAPMTMPLNKISQIRSTKGFLVYESYIPNLSNDIDNPIHQYQKTDIFAILAGIFTLSFFLLPVGFVMGIISLRRIKRHPELYKGKGLAIAAVAVSGAVLLIYLAALVVFLAFVL